MGEILKGRSAVVTGSGRGIGREIALAMAAQGAKVVVNDPGVARDGSGADLAPADEVVAEIKKAGGIAVANYDSVADFKAAENIIKTCVDNFGRIDILVNCAGVLRERMIFNMSEDDWDAVVNVHLKGTFNCTRHASLLMRDQRYGRIINTVSVAFKGTVGQSNYGAAKGGILSFTRSVARELGRYNITCNAFAPLAATRMTVTPEVKAGWKKRYEAGLITKEYYDFLLNMPGPEHIPPIVVYLASDAAADINGQLFHAERGKVAIASVSEEVRTIFTKDMWTVEELADLVPKTLLVGYVNPAPPEKPKEG